jgi:hypothetical protein
VVLIMLDVYATPGMRSALAQQHASIAAVYEALPQIIAVAAHLTPVEDLVEFQSQVEALYAQLEVLVTASTVIAGMTEDGLALLDADTHADQRAVLGLGTAATQSAETFALQEDLLALQTSVTGAAVIDSIADGDTTHPPSRNAVFDALVTKADLVDGLIPSEQIPPIDLVLDKNSVGLGNVDNTSDANKPVSTAQQNALDLKANIASPTFTGTPAAPTPAAGDSSTKLATTAFVRIPAVSSAASGALTPTAGDDMCARTGVSAGLTLNNPTGAWQNGQGLVVRLKDDGTARALTFDTKYREVGETKPTTTVAGKTMYLGFIYNATDDKFDLVTKRVQA